MATDAFIHRQFNKQQQRFMMKGSITGAILKSVWDNDWKTADEVSVETFRAMRGLGYDTQINQILKAAELVPSEVPNNLGVDSFFDAKAALQSSLNERFRRPSGTQMVVDGVATAASYLVTRYHYDKYRLQHAHGDPNAAASKKKAQQTASLSRLHEVLSFDLPVRQDEAAVAPQELGSSAAQRSLPTLAPRPVESEPSDVQHRGFRHYLPCMSITRRAIGLEAWAYNTDPAKKLFVAEYGPYLLQQAAKRKLRQNLFAMRQFDNLPAEKKRDYAQRARSLNLDAMLNDMFARIQAAGPGSDMRSATPPDVDPRTLHRRPEFASGLLNFARSSSKGVQLFILEQGVNLLRTARQRKTAQDIIAKCKLEYLHPDEMKDYEDRAGSKDIYAMLQAEFCSDAFFRAVHASCR